MMLVLSPAAYQTGWRMSWPATEAADERYRGLDTWQPAAILSALADGHDRAIDAARSALPAIARAAEAAADALRGGGRLVYLGAGSSGLIALLDALEIPQTYGIAPDRIVMILAGGAETAANLTGISEDDADEAVAAIRRQDIAAGDVVVGVSASGSTPYTVAGLQAAHDAGATTVAIASNAEAPLLAIADIAIATPTGAEVIAGSTRMAAGTAQKAVFNMLSTLTAIRLGHVHDNLMVNLRADNAKLRRRAGAIISRVTGVDADRAADALGRAGGDLKTAILLASGVADPDEARRRLADSQGRVRPAMAATD